MTSEFEAQAQRNELVLLTRFFLGKLGSRQQEAIRLWAQGYTGVEIARKLAFKSRGGPWMAIQAGLKELRANFREIGIAAPEGNEHAHS